jgi:hypothetical protein
MTLLVEKLTGRTKTFSKNVLASSKIAGVI